MKGINFWFRYDKGVDMARKAQQDDTRQFTFDFLLSEYKLYADNLWSTFDKVWEIYRFYITIISGLGGILLGLLSLGTTWQVLYPLPSIFGLTAFILGISLFIQLINADIAFKKMYKRMMLARQQIATLTSLDDYFSDVSKAKAEWMYWDSSYSIGSLLKRAVRGAGIKTQIIIVNSIVGISSVISLLVTNVKINLSSLILISVIGYFLIVLCHAIIAHLKGRLEE